MLGSPPKSSGTCKRAIGHSNMGRIQRSRAVSPEDASTLIRSAWPMIIDECRAVQAGELHYQAIVYHCLRAAGCPRDQIGMNAKQWIETPVTEAFKSRAISKNAGFQIGFEPIPDIVLFRPAIEGNWQRRNYANTLRQMVCAIEVKASERAKSRLSVAEIRRDIEKFAAHRDEVAHLGGAMMPVMMVIDVALSERERMLLSSVEACHRTAATNGVKWLYGSSSTIQRSCA